MTADVPASDFPARRDPRRGGTDDLPKVITLAPADAIIGRLLRAGTGCGNGLDKAR